MKNLFCCLLMITLFTNCGNKAAKEKELADQKNAALIQTRLNQVVGIGRVEPENEIIQSASPVSGIVSKILKKENDAVKEGEAILEIDNRIEDAKCKQLSDAVMTQEAQIKMDEAAIQEYQAKYSNAVSESQRLQRLLAKGAETQQAVDDANTNLQSFQSNLNRLHAGVAVSKSKLAETRSALEVAKREKDQKIIRSPVDGKILEITAIIGSSLDTKQSFAQIRPIGKTIAVCEVDELFADKVNDGQKAWIRKFGSLDTLSTGTVFFSSSLLKKKSLFTDQAGEKEDRRVREIKIMLDHPEKLLLNSRVECVIDISGNTKN